MLEAVHRVSTDEFPLWLLYRQRFGSLSVSSTVEWYGALNAYAGMMSAGGDKDKVKLSDLLQGTWTDDDDDDVAMTPEQIHAMMQQFKMIASKSSHGKGSGRKKYVVRKKREVENGN